MSVELKKRKRSTTSTKKGSKKRKTNTILTLTPPVFSLDEKDKYLEYLDNNGFVAIGGVLTKEEQDTALDLFRTAWTTVSPTFDFSNLESCDIRNSPMMYDKGMASFSGFSQSEFMWNLRLNPKIQQIFKNVYTEEDLVVSFNAFSVFFDPRQQSDRWWHVDQAPSNPAYCVQGAYNFLPVQEDSAGFIVVPGSHKLPLPTNIRKEKRDWIVFDEHDPFVSENGRKLVIPENCLVLWNSRTIHANIGMDASVVRSKRLDRITAYISYMPKKLRTDEVLEARLNAYANAVACSHWANKCHEKKYPWGFGPRYESRGYRSITPLMPIPEDRLKFI
jgi:ectoine hydroxylase-related dioxygenase (phytanoyl-CoA dioxygenase family)